MQHEDDNLDYAEYRMKPSYFYQMVVYTMIFIIIDVGTVLLVMSNIDGSIRRPIPFAIFVGTFWSGWVCLGIYGIAAFFYERLILQPFSFTQRSLLSNKKFQLDQIEGVDWQILPTTGRIKIHSNRTKVRVYIAQFLKQDSEEIIDYFRSAVPKELQTGWEESQERISRIQSRPSEFTWQFYARMSMLFILGSIASFYLRSYETDMDLALLVIGVGCILLGVASLAGSLFCFYKKNENSQSFTELDDHRLKKAIE